jgi:MFS family permease
MHSSRHRWFVLAAMFAFILLHQADKLLIGPLTTPIMEEFEINEAQMGLVFSGAIVVGAIFYPLWGYLYDRFARAKLLSLAALLWGATTGLSAVMRTFPAFLVTRASTGIDDSSYPGLYSLIADYFPPKMRGRINGLLQVAMPIGYLAGMVLALLVVASVGWRGVFYITGSLGIVLAAAIFFGVKEPKRGASEPELQGIAQMSDYRFDWRIARGLLRNRSLLLLIGNGFFGVFPWQVITFWFFRYLETERGYDANQVLLTMVLAVLVLAGGYPVGGILGDWAFRRTPRGRMLVSAAGAIIGAILLAITLHVPAGEALLFGLMLCLTALFMPFASPNVTATVYDVTLPEVRSTAYSLLNFGEQIGSSTAPALAGLIAVRYSLGNAILYICTSAWVVCFVFLLLTAHYVPKDIAALRQQLEQRAAFERAREQSAAPAE